LVPLTTVYLAFPLGLFVAGFLRPVPAILLFLALAWGTIRLAGCKPLPFRASVPSREIWMCLALAAGLCFVAGIGGLTFQNPDWVKHNAILFDLVRSRWPVAYPGEPGRQLTYCLAYYLPAAGLGKLLASHQVAHLALLVWSSAGVALVIGWLSVDLGRPLLAGVLFFLFSGPDLLGHLALHGWPSPTEHLDAWARSWQYSSHTTQLFWVPQHALPGWLGTALLLHLSARDRWTFGLLLLMLTFAWSPFVTIGLLPLMAVLLFRDRASWRAGFSGANLAVGLPLTAMLVLYYSSRGPDANVGFVWQGNQPLGVLLLWLFLEVALWAAALLILAPAPLEGGRALMVTALVVLFLLPCYRMGIFNDFVMRCSIPALYLVALHACYHVARRPPAWLLVLFLLGVATPAFELARTLTRLNTPRLASAPVVFMLPQFASQYLGSPDSFFYRWLARPARPYPH
jgi:hypothetical protein